MRSRFHGSVGLCIVEPNITLALSFRSQTRSRRVSAMSMTARTFSVTESYEFLQRNAIIGWMPAQYSCLLWWDIVWRVISVVLVLSAFDFSVANVSQSSSGVSLIDSSSKFCCASFGGFDQRCALERVQRSALDFDSIGSHSSCSLYFFAEPTSAALQCLSSDKKVWFLLCELLSAVAQRSLDIL